MERFPEGTLSYGLYILTACENGIPFGCIVNVAFQVTASPVKIAVSCSRDNFTHDKIKSCGAFGLTVLSESVDPALIRLFGFKSGRTVDKFEGIRWEKGEKTGVPILPEKGMTVLECRVTNAFDAGTHTLFVGEVENGKITDPSAKEITYRYYHKVLKGIAPKNAPTYTGKAHLKQP
ncbi:MAG: flavin reductase family protein [Pontiellaceae bacterium]|jgi:flavin reductase (DIM6/NTAB) family NADH-FMN oxidoreductase RutF|nr:flavin reductase family protein [Pontiellaceae bacterium]